jgi:hypothetical protein
VSVGTQVQGVLVAGEGVQKEGLRALDAAAVAGLDRLAVGDLVVDVQGRVEAQVVLGFGDGGGHLAQLEVGVFEAQADLGGDLLAERPLVGSVEGVDLLVHFEAVGDEGVGDQGGRRRAAPGGLAEDDVAALQLVAGAQLGVAGHGADIGAGQAEDDDVEAVVGGFIEVGGGRQVEVEDGGEGDVAAVAVQPHLVGPVMAFGEAGDDPGGGADVVALEAEVEIAVVAGGGQAGGVDRLQGFRARADVVDVVAAQLAAEGDHLAELVLEAEAAEGDVGGAFEALALAGGGEDGAGEGVEPFAQAVAALAADVPAIAEVAREGQVAKRGVGADAEVPALAIADIGADRAGGGVARLHGRGLGDQVDDPAGAFRAVGGAGVGHHLDAGILVGGQGEDGLGAAIAAQHAGRATVDEDGDVGVAAQGDVALRVDIDAGDVAQGVGQGAGSGLQVIGQGIAGGVDRGADLGWGGRDLDGVDGGLFLGGGLGGGGRRGRGGRGRGLGDGGTGGEGREGGADKQTDTERRHEIISPTARGRRGPETGGMGYRRRGCGGSYLLVMMRIGAGPVYRLHHY